MAKLPVEDPIKPVIIKAKQKRKAKINKKPNEAKAQVIKQAIVAEKKVNEKPAPLVAKKENKKPKPVADKKENKRPAPVVDNKENKKPAPVVGQNQNKKPASVANKKENKKSFPAADKEENINPAPVVAQNQNKKPAHVANKKENKKSAPAADKEENKKPAPVAGNKQNKKPAPVGAQNNKPASTPKVEQKVTPPNPKSEVKVGKKNKKKNAVPVAQVEAKEEVKSSTEVEEKETKNEKPPPIHKNQLKQFMAPVEVAAKYPILNNKELIKKFLGVSLTNNQKGRIRQHLKDSLKGASDSILPSVINGKLKSIIKNNGSLSDIELRKVRILYNMLKIAAIKESSGSIKVEKSKKRKRKGKKVSENGAEVAKENGVDEDESKQENEEENKKSKKMKIEKNDNENKGDKKQNDKKVKGPKRYVVFVGNLPLDIDREKLMQHFSDLKDHIVDVRIPKVAEGKKTAIAYVELKNEPSYELALSKHHSMLNNRRINVLFSAQQNSKMSKSEIKSKAAKLVALQKSGKLAGSVPLNKKRSQRRAKAKKAQATSDD